MVIQAGNAIHFIQDGLKVKHLVAVEFQIKVLHLYTQIKQSLDGLD